MKKKILKPATRNFYHIVKIRGRGTINSKSQQWRASIAGMKTVIVKLVPSAISVYGNVDAFAGYRFLMVPAKS